MLAHRRDAPDFSCGLEVSGDGGRTWGPAQPITKLPAGAEKCYAPEVAFDRSGRLYFLFVGLAGAGNRPMGAFLTSSSDHARTFTTPGRILGPLKFGVRMAIDTSWGAQGRIHIVWVDSRSDVGLGAFGPPPNPVMTAHSDNGGRSFSKPVQVSDVRRERVVAPALALAPHHGVDIVFYDLGRDAVDYQGLEGPVWEEPWSLVLSRSRDGGASFDPEVVVDDGVIAPERVMLIFTMPPPSLAMRGGHLCLAWADGRFGDSDVLLRCSSDAGRHWAPVERVNDDKRNDGRRQYLPRLGWASSGRLDLAFLDRRDDYINRSNHVYYAYSTDNGHHFSRNVRVTRVNSDATVGSRYAGAAAKNQVEFGSRIGVLSMRDRVVVAWPDTRNTTTSGTAQEIFVADVAVRGPSHPARPAGIALALLGVAGLVAVLLRKRSAAPADEAVAEVPT
ncbi:MAG TPA: sialidase family protein [Acidimicrobiales bacterium]|nr:sialidase family protein [Acidimicrobiales bacterium]